MVGVGPPDLAARGVCRDRKVRIDGWGRWLGAGDSFRVYGAFRRAQRGVLFQRLDTAHTHLMVLVWGCIRTLYRLLVAGRGRPRFVGHYRPLFRGHCGHPSPDRRPILLPCGAESARDGETVDGVVPWKARRFLSDPSRGEQYFEVASDHPLAEANASGKVFLTRIRTGSVAVGVLREGIPDGHR